MLFFFLTSAIELKKWKPLGPLKTPPHNENFTGWSANGLGRIMDCAVNPSNTKQIWVVSPNGGLFYTENRGKKWKNIALPTPGGASQLAIQTLPSGMISLYIGSNVTYSKRKSYSYGIYSTLDNGKTWTTVKKLKPQEYKLSEIKAMEFINGTLFYAINKTIYSYSNGKEKSIYKSKTKVSTIKPGASKKIWYICGESIAVTINNGESFNTIKTNSEKEFRVKRCDISYGNNKTIIASYENNGSFFYELDKNNALTNRQRTRAKIDINRTLIVFDSFRKQFLVGGVRLYRFNAGKTVQITRPKYPHVQYVHDDIRRIIIDPNGTILIAHDAGISSSNNGGEGWKNINGCGLNITEFYDFDFNGSKLVAGAQDLSSFIYDEKNRRWSHISQLYGDGGSCLVKNDSWLIMRGRQPMKSIDNGASFKYENFPKSITGFNPIMRKDNNNSYLANKHLWLLKKGYWYDISKDVENSYALSGLAIKNNFIMLSKEDPVWNSKNMKGKLFRSYTSGKKWEDITHKFHAYAYREISDLCFGKNNEDAIYACLGSFDNAQGTREKVYMSTDYGDTWKNISYNLPNSPCNVIKDLKGKGLFVGTDQGLYILKEQQWLKAGEGLPEVPITQIKMDDTKIVVSTYGRGVWVLK